MVRAPFLKLAAIGGLVALAVACRSRPSSAIDASLARALPGEATVIAGVNLAHVRASPLYRQLPPAAAALLESWRDAETVLIASDGTNYLAVTRGSFRQAPAGATLIATGLAAAGSPDWVRTAQSRRGTASPLLPHAEPLAAAADIWIGAAGNAHLPLSGNAENLTALLHATEYSTLSIRLSDSVVIEAVGMCRAPESAQHLEETLRAYLSFGAAGTKHDPALSGLLRSARLSRQDRAVHLTLTVQANQLEPLWKAF